MFDIIRNGVTYSLDDNTVCRLISDDGSGMLPLHRLSERGPLQHGSTDVGYFYDPRIIMLTLGVNDSTIAAVDVNAASFSNTFWMVSGNAGAATGTHFLGTADNRPLGAALALVSRQEDSKGVEALGVVLVEVAVGPDATAQVQEPALGVAEPIALVGRRNRPLPEPGAHIGPAEVGREHEQVAEEVGPGDEVQVALGVDPALFGSGPVEVRQVVSEVGEAVSVPFHPGSLDVVGVAVEAGLDRLQVALVVRTSVGGVGVQRAIATRRIASGRPVARASSPARKPAEVESGIPSPARREAVSCQDASAKTWS